jgi:hypothetical protein
MLRGKYNQWSINTAIKIGIYDTEANKYGVTVVETEENTGLSHFPFRALQFNYYNLNQQMHTIVLDLQ